MGKRIRSDVHATKKHTSLWVSFSGELIQF